MNPDLAIQDLRRRLIGLRISNIDQRCDEAANTISEGIQNILINALQQSVNYANDIGAHKFIERVNIDTNHFRLVVNGSFDFSQDSMPLLPSILKGKRSQKVPIFAKRVSEKKPIDIVGAMKDRQAEISAAREELRERQINEHTSGSIYNDISHLNQSFNNHRPIPQKAKQDRGPPIAFRTASEDHDPGTKWIRPSKDLDMTSYIAQLNNQVELDIDNLIREVVDKYGRV